MSKQEFIIAALSVGCGGFIGSIARYSLSLISIKMDFPLMTLITNVIGAILIGCISELAGSYSGLSTNTTLFLKTGICGGFTTFSTFSLENATLLENQKYGTAFFYMMSSVIGCLIGVFIGKFIVQSFLKNA